jgi:hypothetical protein
MLKFVIINDTHYIRNNITSSPKRHTNRHPGLSHRRSRSLLPRSGSVQSTSIRCERSPVGGTLPCAFSSTIHPPYDIRDYFAFRICPPPCSKPMKTKDISC